MCNPDTHEFRGLIWRSKDGAQDFLPERLQLVILWFWFKLQPTGKTQVFVNDGSSLKVDITRILLINIIKLIEGRPTKGWIMFLPCKPLMNLQSPTIETIRFIDLIISLIQGNSSRQLITKATFLLWSHVPTFLYSFFWIMIL